MSINRKPTLIKQKDGIVLNLNLSKFYQSKLKRFGKPNSEGFSKALCPFHNDTNPSLSINLIHGGWNCFGCGASGDVQSFYQKIYKVDRKKAIEDLYQQYCIAPKRRSITTKMDQKNQILETYDYTDLKGNLIFQVCRYKPKKFRARRPNGKGGWIWNLKGIRLLPYNIAAVSKAKDIYICEGEKDCDNLKDIGLTATCNPFGAGKWKKHFKIYFEKKNVYIIPDNDQAGLDHANAIAESLYQTAKLVKIVKLPQIPQKGDVSDWLGKDGTRVKLVALAKKQTKKWKPGETPVASFIEELNKKHAAVMIEGQFRILNEETDPKFNQLRVTFSTVADFSNNYLNNKIPNPEARWDKRKTGSTSIAKLWLESPNRREFKGIGFYPHTTDKEVGRYYNLFSGFGTEPKRGDWSLFRDHIFRIIAGGNKEHAEWILNWMAHIVQNPAEKSKISIVLRGGQGTGKGLFATRFGRLFGIHFLHIIHQERISGRFNFHMAYALLAFCDEAFWAGNKSIEGVLKGIITEDEILCEPKGKNTFSIKNHTNFIFASNKQWVIPADLDDRRFFVLDVSNEMKGNQKYFDPIFKQMDEDGGVEAMHYDLLKVQVSKDILKTTPKTTALFDQKLRGNIMLQYWWERLSEKTTISKKRKWFRNTGFGSELIYKDCKYAHKQIIREYQSGWRSIVIKVILYEDFKMFAKELGKSRHILDLRQFIVELRKLCPPIKTGSRKNFGDEKKVPILNIPPLRECRAEFKEALGMRIPWES